MRFLIGVMGLQGEMVSDLHKRRLLILVALVVCVSVFGPIIFGDARTVEGEGGGDSWRNFIYDFQTLLTGILAVGAAWWNVSVMKSVDRETDRRHKETLENALTERARMVAKERAQEASLVEKAINPQYAQIENSKDFLARQREDILQAGRLPAQADRLKDSVEVMVPFMIKLHEALARRQIEDATRFLDGELTYRIDHLRKEVADALRAMEFVRRDNDRWVDTHQVEAKLTKQALLGFVYRADADIDLVLEGMRELASRYGVAVKKLAHI